MFDHHAILLIGDSLSESGFDTSDPQATSEFEFFRFDTLKVADVRVLIKAAFIKPFVLSTKTMVIETATIAPEAQHALLKILEEPPLSTKFILVLPSIESLLPTLLSRLARPVQSVTMQYHTNDVFTRFSEESYAARLEIIAKMAKDKDVLGMSELREGVLWFLEQKRNSAVSEVLHSCVSKMNIRGASKKMLLEEIALTLPLP